MKNKKPTKMISKKTITRRSLLDWLGKATVLSLGGDFLVGCIDGVQDEFPENTDDGGGVGFDDDDDNDNDNNDNNNDDNNDNDDEDAGASGECDIGDNTLTPGDEADPSFDEFKEYTVDPQDLEQILETWSLRVDGLVENPIELSFKELLELPRRNQVTDFHCVVGWSVYDVPWNGIQMKTLFEIVKPTSAVQYVNFHTMGDIYNESLPLSVALEPNSIIAYGVNCATLPLTHGFPVRLVVPRKLGYKNAKYVYRIELSDEELLGYWEQQGYTSDGDVPEDRLRPGKY